MNDIKQELIFVLLICHWLFGYRWFVLKPFYHKKYTFYRIYDKTFRMLYQWKISSITQWMVFIDKNYSMLSNLSQLKPHTINDFEYFNWWYNYYGELINSYWS